MLQTSKTMQQKILFRHIFESLKNPKSGLGFLLAHQQEVRRKMESPAWEIYLSTMLKHEPVRTRRIIRRQLRLFRYLTDPNNDKQPTETQRNRR